MATEEVNLDLQRLFAANPKETLLNNISMLYRLRSFVANPKRTCYFGVRPNKALPLTIKGVIDKWLFIV